MDKSAPVKQQSNVVNLFEYFATCPECVGKTFILFTEPPEDSCDVVKIIGIECDNCKLRLNWE